MRYKLRIDFDADTTEEAGNVMSRVWQDVTEAMERGKKSGGLIDAAGITGSYSKYKDREKHNERPEPLEGA